MDYLCAAYNAAPVSQPWSGEMEGAYYRALQALPRIVALEVPLHATGQIHAQNPAWQLDHLAARWNIVLTLIPGTLQSLQKDPHFGLASASSSGRTAAVRLAEQARQTVQRINAHAGRRAVRWVELHSAPRQGVAGVSASKSALADSVGELQAMDWDGAGLALEHCDRFIAGQPPEKGFLPLEDEIDTLRKAGGRTPVGIVINWGRSAIEGRGAETALNHVRLAKAAGLLRGLTFSGATAKDALYGEWLDQHAPFAPAPGAPSGCPNSLLTVEQAAACLRAAQPQTLDFVGMKVQPLPATLTVEQRLGILRDTIALLDQAVSKAAA